MKHVLLSLVAVVTLALAGCAIGPNYKRPTVDVPGDFRFAANQSTNSFADLPWWEVFKDPTLLDLIRTAVTNNYDLRRAVARVEQARNMAVAHPLTWPPSDTWADGQVTMRCSRPSRSFIRPSVRKCRRGWAN